MVGAESQLSGTQAGMDYLASMWRADQSFRDAVELAYERQMPLQHAVQMIRAVVGPPGSVNWSAVGNPTVSQCEAMSLSLRTFAKALQEEDADLTASPAPSQAVAELVQWESLLSVALFNEIIFCNRKDMIRLLGKQEAIRRIKSFAIVLAASARIG